MKVLIRLIGVLILVAVFLLPDYALILAQGGEDWVVYMTVTTDPNVGSVPGVGSQFGFGAKDAASDGYDSEEGDEIAPPDPISGINAYFYYPDNPPFQKNLIVSVTGPATSMTWPLMVKMVGETGNAQMTISWPDISSVPAKYVVLELQDTEGTILADMRSVDHYTFSASQGQTYNFQIQAEVGLDTTPPTVTDKSPMGSDIPVDSDISVTFSEPMNEASAENAFSIVPDVPGSFGWASNTLTFDPTTNLSHSTEYIITVAGTAEDLAGNGLDGNDNGSAEGSPADDYSWSFTTETAVTYYTLTVSGDPAAGGSVALTPEQPAGGYAAGTSVQLTATANEGYAFGSWSGALSGSTNPDTITMDSAKSVTANFVVLSAPENVDLTGADPGVESITVSSIDLGEVDTTNMPEDIEPQEAYVVSSTGTGSFTLRFTNIANAHSIVIYKVFDSTWTQIPATAITVIDATTIEVTMEVGDPILVFSKPTGAPPTVGGDAFLPNKLLLLMPWIGLAAAIIAGASLFVLKRRRA
jgi:hypothetical protein